jgi:extradiol dioxygenase family protein
MGNLATLQLQITSHYMPKTPPFHLSMFAKDLGETKHFYIDLIGAKLAHESNEGWINIEWFGHQLTFHEKLDMQIKQKNDFHWGFNLPLDQFNSLAEKIRTSPELNFELEPTRKSEGTDIERIKMYFKDPNGHLIEVKHFVEK